jgi:hypothetical protein
LLSSSFTVFYGFACKCFHTAHRLYPDQVVGGGIASISNTPTKLVIAKIYKDGKVFAENIEFVEFKSQNQRGHIEMFDYRPGMGALVKNNGTQADIGFASGNVVHAVRLEE